jgi:hypothetical protein
MTISELIHKLKEFPEDMEVIVYDENRKEWKEVINVSQTKTKYNGMEAGINFYNYDFTNEAELRLIIN